MIFLLHRYFAIVPVTYLYYFENETSEAPKGIVDLGAYNAIRLCQEPDQGRRHIIYMGQAREGESDKR